MVIAYLCSDIEYVALSGEQQVFADSIVFHPIDMVSLVSDLDFDYIVVVSDRSAEVLDILCESINTTGYDIIDLNKASETLDTFDGRIQFLVKHFGFGTPGLPDNIIKPSNCSIEDPMHIVMSFNSKFILPAAETIYTLFLHNDNIILHILYIDLTEDERRKIEKFTLMDGDFSIKWHLIEDDLMDKIHFDPGRFSVYTLFRFYSYKILDEKIERCLWLDADLMIRGDVRELYNTDMGDEWYFTSALESSAFFENPIQNNTEYTNIGILLMNLKKLRSDEMMDRFWEFLFDPDFDYPNLEQDALNIVFRRKIKFVEQGIWNSFPISEMDDSVPIEKVQAYANQARVVHFLSSKKAWLDEFAPYWEDAARKIPYTGIMYREYKKYLKESEEYMESGHTR